MSAACGCSCSRRRTCAPAGGSRARQYQFTLWDADLDELLRLVPRVVARVTDAAGAGRRHHRPRAGRLAGQCRDRPRRRRRGSACKIQDIDNALNNAFSQRQISTIYSRAQPVSRHPRSRSAVPARSVRSEPVYVAGHRQRPGAAVRVARVEKTLAPLVINHQGSFPAVTITYNLAPNVTLEQASAAIAAGGRRAASARHAARRIRRRRQAFGAQRRHAAAGDPCGAAGDLHHPRRAVREPGASADDHLDPAVGRPRRAAGAAICSAPS